MADEKGTALAVRKPSDLAGVQMKTPAEMAERIRELQGQAFILSPMVSVSAIASGFVVNAAVVPIDPSVDTESGAGADVYHQASIHKRMKVDGKWVPAEVSLNKIGLLKILTGAGVNVYPLRRLDDGTIPFYWSMEAEGDVTDFDGRIRRLPPGIVDVDLRDGSPQIGYWTAEKWAEKEKEAHAKRLAQKLPEDQYWKVKPESINGWTGERVMQQRRFGLRLAATKALNALARGLGVAQKYTIEELRAKPFVIFRSSFVPDMSDPEVRRMVTASALGARGLLYGGREAEPIEGGAITHGHGDPTATLNGHVIDQPEPAPMPAAAEPVQTSEPPNDAREVDLSEQVAKESSDRFIVTKVRQRGEGVAARSFFETKQGVTFFTTDLGVARVMNGARKSGVGLSIDSERISVEGKAYQSVVNVEPALTKL